MNDIIKGRSGVRAMALDSDGQVIDDFRYEGLEGLHIDTSYLYNKNHWICTAGDLFIICQYKMGILTMGVGLTEDESKDTISIIAKTGHGYGLPKLRFIDIMRFMRWTCDDYWDN